MRVCVWGGGGGRGLFLIMILLMHKKVFSPEACCRGQILGQGKMYAISINLGHDGSKNSLR